MIKRTKLKKSSLPKLYTISEKPLSSKSSCDCLQKFNNSQSVEDDETYELLEGIWSPHRRISNHEELMAITHEPIFVTGRTDHWQIKELRANTRELGICKHFLPSLTVEYLCYFVEKLLLEKKAYLKKNAINHPVAFYMWHYYDSDWGGRAFLCYDFISGKSIENQFSRKTIQNQLSFDAFMRRFLMHKTKKYNLRQFHVIGYVLNGEREILESDALSDQQCEDLYETFYDEGNFKDCYIPKSLMKQAE